MKSDDLHAGALARVPPDGQHITGNETAGNHAMNVSTVGHRNARGREAGRGKGEADFEAAEGGRRGGRVSARNEFDGGLAVERAHRSPLLAQRRRARRRRAVLGARASMRPRAHEEEERDYAVFSLLDVIVNAVSAARFREEEKEGGRGASA